MHCKNIKRCYTSMFPLRVSTWKSSFPCCLRCFTAGFSPFHADGSEPSKPGEESELHCSFVGSSSSVIMYSLFLHLCLFPFFFIMKAQGTFLPSLSSVDFVFWQNHSWFNIYVFPKETLKFLKKNQLSHSIPKSISCTLLFLGRGTSRSLYFQVPTTALS